MSKKMTLIILSNKGFFVLYISLQKVLCFDKNHINAGHIIMTYSCNMSLKIMIKFS